MMMVYVEESTSYKVYKVGLQNCDDKFFYFIHLPCQSQIWDPAPRKLTIRRYVVFEKEFIVNIEGSSWTLEQDYLLHDSP